jgi:hypothetical protein
MDVDVSQEEAESAHDDDSEHAEEDEDTEEEEEPSGVSMVPLADMLNAQYGSENVRILFIILCNNEDLNPCQAKLFHEKDDLRMVSTKLIKAGEQIVCAHPSPVTETTFTHPIPSGTLTATYPTPSYYAVTATSTCFLCQMETSVIRATSSKSLQISQSPSSRQMTRLRKSELIGGWNKGETSKFCDHSNLLACS